MLTYNFTDIENFEELCYQEINGDAELHGYELSDRTAFLLAMMMSCGICYITTENILEVLFRICVSQEAWGEEIDQKDIAKLLVDHIGIDTNIAALSREDFYAHLKSQFYLETKLHEFVSDLIPDFYTDVVDEDLEEFGAWQHG